MIGQVWQWLAEIPDPEVPVVSIVELGMIRDVIVEQGLVEVLVAPTYSGCPATEVIENDISAKLEQHGVASVSVKRVLSPPWTTDWISEAGRKKLKAYGIAPPTGSADRQSPVRGEQAVSCPRCDSAKTTLVSEFGSTACKASWKCEECLEPFEYFKCI